jgi:hypothetical protein
MGNELTTSDKQATSQDLKIDGRLRQLEDAVDQIAAPNIRDQCRGKSIFEHVQERMAEFDGKLQACEEVLGLLHP